MAKKPKAPPVDDDPGAPEWMVTFSDCMTLLLTFFVLLLSFSSFDDKVFPKMQSAFAEGLSSIGLDFQKNNTALEMTPRNEELENGSETRTMDGQYQSNPSTSMDFMNFQNQKVFLVPSTRVFLGHGTRMSSHGRQMLTDLAELLRAVPNRVVVAEHAIGGGDASRRIGLTRAWTVTQFLTENRGLKKTRFSISAAGTTDPQTVRQSGVLAANPRADRVVEIVILEQGTYN